MFNLFNVFSLSILPIHELIKINIRFDFFFLIFETSYVFCIYLGLTTSSTYVWTLGYGGCGSNNFASVKPCQVFILDTEDVCMKMFIIVHVELRLYWSRNSICNYCRFRYLSEGLLLRNTVYY